MCEVHGGRERKALPARSDVLVETRARMLGSSRTARNEPLFPVSHRSRDDRFSMSRAARNHANIVSPAFLIHETMPDITDTNMGYHMGKDWSCIETLLSLYDVEDKLTVFYFLRHIQARHSNKINKDLNAKSKSKAKAG